MPYTAKGIKAGRRLLAWDRVRRVRVGGQEVVRHERRIRASDLPFSSKYLGRMGQADVGRVLVVDHHRDGDWVDWVTEIGQTASGMRFAGLAGARRCSCSLGGAKRSVPNVDDLITSDPRRWTAAQRRRVARWLVATKSEARLSKDLDIIRDQQRRAYRDSNDAALQKLRIMEDLTIEARWDAAAVAHHATRRA